MSTLWDPDAYLARRDERARPFHDLLFRVHAESPRAVVDLGCGPGNLTGLMRLRWPSAPLRALDSSPEMVAAARAAGIDAQLGDVTQWRPGPDADVVVCNAVLQWVPGHPELLRRWAAELPSGAWLAIQVPANFDAPSHSAARRLVELPRWRDRIGGSLRGPDAVLDAAGYAELLAGAGCEVDAWETTYLHRLAGPDPVLDWMTGTALRPVRSALTDEEWVSFCAELAPRLRQAYPARADGTTWLPFRRVFAVART
ncbi:MAG TPA: trans-aconitate 2-methyltransferase [Pseudonocardiaceae bacterium]|nr:trans-aconitate 2-methyltransferase [Pseudonocardiaceae bacterium]